MGWWSADIMGGDPAYDAHAWVWDRALALEGHEDKDYSWVLDQEWSSFDHDQDILRECLTPENITTMLQEIQAGDAGRDETDVCAQVLALMIIESGAPFPEELRPEFISLIAADDWATYDQERAVYVLDLVRRVESYVEGEKHDVPHKGLMETMGEFLGGLEKRNPADEGMVLTPEEAERAQHTLGTLVNG